MSDVKEEQVKAIQKEVLPGLNRVVSGELEIWRSGHHFPLGLLLQTLEEDGFDTFLDEMDTNGWQWDYWVNVEKDGKEFTVGGSGYYGGFAFYPKEN